MRLSIEINRADDGRRIAEALELLGVNTERLAIKVIAGLRVPRPI